MRGRLKTAWEWRGAIVRALFGIGLLVWALVKFATGDWFAGACMMFVVIVEAARWAFYGWAFVRMRRSGQSLDG